MKYLTAFITGLATAFLIAFIFALKKINVTNADTVIQSMEQTIKKLKQKGEGNELEVSSSVEVQAKTKRELRKEKRELRRAQKQ